MRTRTVAAAVAVVLFSGCAYTVPPVSVRAPNVYSSYDAKIAGSYALVLDDSVRSVSRQVRASSHVCSAHNYPVDMGNAVASSIKGTLESIFESVVERTVPPSREVMITERLAGVVRVKLDDFSPRLQCSQGFWTGTCTSSTEVAFGVDVRGPEGTVLAASASGSKTADGDSGGACEGAATVLSDSIGKSMKDALERLGERIANSPRLRPAATK